MKDKILLLLSELEKLKHQSIDLNRETNMKIQAAIDNNVQLFGLPEDLTKLDELKLLTIRLTYLVKDLELHEINLLNSCGD